MKDHIPKVHTILFTEDCPLCCNYCNLRANDKWETQPAYTKEEFFQEVADNMDSEILLFTGGEPFTRWPWIKEVIEKYGDHFKYTFNTCGYLCTEENLEFLSHYRVQFYLSMDGPREIALWRRPNAYNNNYDYWDRVEKIIPIILYYWPHTAWKSIISKRLIPFLPKIYLAAANYGFKMVHFEMDFEEQPWRQGRGDYWTDEDYANYQLAVDTIVLSMVQIFKEGGIPPMEMGMASYISRSLKSEGKTDFTARSLNCGLAAHRDLSSVYKREASHCMGEVESRLGVSFEEILTMIEEDYAEGCGHDKSCPFFDYCARFACTKDNYSASGHFMTPNEEWCHKTKIFNGAAVKLLSIGMEFLIKEPSYNEFIKNMLRGRY